MVTKLVSNGRTFRREWLHNALVFGIIFSHLRALWSQISIAFRTGSISGCTLLFVSKVFLGFDFWTFINVQKQEMEKSLGKTGFEKSF